MEENGSLQQPQNLERYKFYLYIYLFTFNNGTPSPKKEKAKTRLQPQIILSFLSHSFHVILSLPFHAFLPYAYFGPTIVIMNMFLKWF